MHIFWADGTGIRNYQQYGDLLSFDTTYKTNKYNLKFAPFVGVNGHGDNCLFACGFIQDEKKEIFEWLYKTFLKCMGGKAPKSVITDQDAAMKKAVPKCFSSCMHRNCLFHILTKAQNKARRTFARNEHLNAQFHDIILNSQTVEEFEHLGPQMIQQHNVQHIKHFGIMWKNRKRFVPAYFKNDFFPFIQSTARTEGTNVVFKANVGSSHSVIAFMTEFDRISQSIEEKKRK